MAGPLSATVGVAPAPVRSARLQLAPDGTLGSALARARADQAQLTAVERFARVHDDAPPSARKYRDLIPVGKPGEGQQYAFEVDLDACTGCKACVAACHSMNGLRPGESWRTVGLLHGGSVDRPVQRTVTTSCHHCVDPACMSGCPVRAYEKDPASGIVKHLDDQCIGCQYCTFTCPYDAPKYNEALGIVRKCDMCSGRLAAGEAPACVQACPNGAIRIRIADQSEAVQSSEAGTFLPGTAAPDHTLPTTRYVSKQAMPGNLLPADFYRSSPAHAHPPLVIMLVLTQLAAGAYAGDFAAERWMGVSASPWRSLFALGLALLALGASTLHLGRPLGAWRAFLGLGTSWMSREILAFGAYAGLGVAVAVARFAEPLGLPGRGLLLAAAPVLRSAAAVAALAGVFCSVMIYVATKRAHWGFLMTGTKFLSTTVVLGAAWLSAAVVGEGAVLGTLGAPEQALVRWLTTAVALVGGAKLLAEASVFRALRSPAHGPVRRVAVLLAGDLAPVTFTRFLCGLFGLLILPLALRAQIDGTPSGGAFTLAILVALLATTGELCERFLFFAAAPPSRMPGGLS